MKPGDHPDFFRFPAPAGRSRESGIRLDRDGRFWDHGERVEHEGMARAFASWIARHPDDGRFILTNGYDWTYFEVEDTPFVVQSVRDGPGRPELVLSDGSSEPLDPDSLRLGEGSALYCSVKQRSFEARFTPQAQNALAPWLAEREDGVVLKIGDSTYPITER